MSPQSLLALAAVVLLVAVLAVQVLTLKRLRQLHAKQERFARRQSRQAKRLSTTAQGQRGAISRTQTQTLVQVESLLDLYSLVTPRTSMPSTQGWATAPSTMQALVRTVLDRKPATVVECGSGSSSVWIGYALQRNGHGRCIALEHDARYAEASRALVRSHGLEHVVDVRLAPLKEVTVGTETHLWYDTQALADLSDIGLAFVDGPPGTVGPLSRFPALPVMSKHCAPDAVFILDDAARPDEQEILRRWIADYDGVPLEQGHGGTGWRSIGLPEQQPGVLAAPEPKDSLG